MLMERRAAAIHAKLCALGIDLSRIQVPQARKSYKPALRVGNLLYLSGHLPYDEGGNLITGKVGLEHSAQSAIFTARLVAILMLKTLQASVEGLDRVDQIVKVSGYINCDPVFKDHFSVLNGASELFVQVFGEHGMHTCTAIGASSLPFDVPVEIEMIVQIKE